MNNKRWYPKTLGRAARYLRRNYARGLNLDKERYYRQLVCQIKLDHSLERGIKHSYDVTTGEWNDRRSTAE